MKSFVKKHIILFTVIGVITLPIWIFPAFVAIVVLSIRDIIIDWSKG